MRRAHIGLLMLATLLFATGTASQARAAATETAVFAGGCFWCMEEAFDKVAGVLDTTSGYTGGMLRNPTYEQVSSQKTGHKEAVRVLYDPARVGYAQLLEVFWRNVDPFDAAGQFCDKGDSYRSAIFVRGAEQSRLAEQTKQMVEARFKRPVATAIRPLTTFYPAEGYHQNYHDTNPLRYQYYKWRCGRAQQLEQIWGPAPP